MTTPKVSFEFFPPKSLSASFQLWDTMQTLSPLSPEFMSVTYGAGGTTRALTHDTVTALSQHSATPIAAHLTCVNAKIEDTKSIVDTYSKAGIRQFVALRGDAPKGTTRFEPHPDGFKDTCDLISHMKDWGDFKIRVGAYPEKHPDAAHAVQDVLWLKEKFNAGADEALTQFFFEADTFLRFRDRCAKAGIDAPIIPGILPIENFQNCAKFAKTCGAHVPNWLVDAFETAKRDNREDLLALATATELISTLQTEGVNEFHFFTLNKPNLTLNICRAIGVKEQLHLSAVA